MEDRKFHVYWSVQDSSYQRVIRLTSVLEINGSQKIAEHIEYQPAYVSDYDIAASALTWAALGNDVFYGPVEYGNNLDTEVSNLLNFNKVKPVRIEDKNNQAWKRNVLSEAREDSFAKAGIVG